jgi:hypothetical protein
MQLLKQLKKVLKAEIILWVITGILLLLSSCKKHTEAQPLATITPSETKTLKPDKNPKISPEFKAYWYAGEAEITSYKLQQARYGELHEGTAVLVYVTEDFLPDVQVKANNPSKLTVPVLKLNAIKKFNTGIYPYSIMQSTFYPVANNQHAIKVSSSVQEWCGHAYTQINNRNAFEITSHSYFEGEADQQFSLDKAILENELWLQLRINPQALPTGHLKIIPALEFHRLRHVTIKAYQATATLQANTYTINYPELNRTLSITFNPNFPYEVLAWEETSTSGFGKNAKTLTTKATKLNTIKSAYWKKNSNKDVVLRDLLKLKE